MTGRSDGVPKANESSLAVGSVTDSGSATEKRPTVSGRPTTVSVVMATYNGERYLRAQLATILQCLDEVDQLIVVDDCSIESTLAILRGMKWADLLTGRVHSALGWSCVAPRGKTGHA